MPQLRLSYAGFFKDLTDKRDEPYWGEEATLGQLVESLATRYGPDFRQAVLDTERGTLLSHSSVLVNQQPRPLEWKLAEGDEVVFLTAFAGGGEALSRKEQGG